MEDKINIKNAISQLDDELAALLLKVLVIGLERAMLDSDFIDDMRFDYELSEDEMVAISSLAVKVCDHKKGELQIKNFEEFNKEVERLKTIRLNEKEFARTFLDI